MTDFIVGEASYFQTGGSLDFMTEDDISGILAQPGIENSGRVYGKPSASSFMPEEIVRDHQLRWNAPEVVDTWLESRTRDETGQVMDDTDIFGMEDFALDHLTVLEGDLAPLYDPEQDAIAAVYLTGDYGEVHDDSHWAKPGDKIKVRRVDEWKYYTNDTNEEIPREKLDSDFDSLPPFREVPYRYEDKEYTVCATVTMPHSMSFRFYGSFEYVLNAGRFKADLQNEDILNLLLDVEDSAEGSMEAYLKEYTESLNPMMDYESKQSYTDEFESFRNMFFLMGGALSFIVGLVGVLNFFNAVLTSIMTRRREFAVLQSIGMTGRQLKKMLICEGLIYAGLAIGVSFVMAVATGPLLGEVMGGMFWFFTYRMSILPILVLLPVFAVLGAGIPLLLYRVVSRQSIVERIRAND